MTDVIIAMSVAEMNGKLPVIKLNQMKIVLEVYKKYKKYKLSWSIQQLHIL